MAHFDIVLQMDLPDSTQLQTLRGGSSNECSTFKRLLNALREGASTTVTGKIFQELITLFEKLFARSFNLALFFIYNLKAWPLVAGY